MRSLRTLLLIVFFAGLAVLEISHGLFRIETIRDDRRRELLGAVERGHAEQARALRVALEQGRRDAAQLARLTDVATLLSSGPQPDGGSTPDAGGASRALWAMVGAVPHFAELSLFDGQGRVRWSAGHGTPEEALAKDLEGTQADPTLTRLAGSLAPGVVFQTRAYVTPVTAGGARLGFLVLTIDSTPLQQALDFRPLPGAVTLLVDDRGRDATGTWPGPVPRELLSTPGRPLEVPAAAVAGPARTETPERTFVSLAVSEFPHAPLFLVTVVPQAALEPPAGQYAWTVAVMVAITTVLGAAGFFILRLSERAFRLAESERALRREQEVAKQLQIAERLSSVGLLTAGVAHEINNPLEGIGNYLSMLEKEGLDAERRGRYLGQVRHGFERIREIVADLLRFSRPTTGEHGRTDLAAVVERSVSMAGYGKHFKQVAVERQGFERPLVVHGDAGRLEQVLLNLLLNAARAMGGEGRITITGTRTTDASGARWIELTVADEGTGIAPEHLDKLFDPFFSASGGTGLGLSVSYGIVKAHGGTLTAANRSPRGACFTLRLPAGPAEENAT